MLKFNLNKIATAGKVLHQNILKPMARATPRQQATPAAYYQDRNAGGTSIGQRFAAKVGSFFNGTPSGARAYPQVPKAEPVAFTPPGTVPRQGVRQPGPQISPAWVVTPQQLPQVRENTLRRARGYSPMYAGAERFAANQPSPRQGLPQKSPLTRSPKAQLPGHQAPARVTALRAAASPPPIAVNTVHKEKSGIQDTKLRHLIREDGSWVYYDKSHVQGAYGRFHRALLPDGTSRGIKQFRLPEYVKMRPSRQGRKKVPLKATSFASVCKEAAQMRDLGINVFGIHRTPDGKAFIETELFAGSLAEKMPTVPTQYRAVVARLSLQSMAEQLAPLHAKGSVHRDIKNENLLYNEQGRVQIGDPGLLITAREIRAKRHGIAGTPCFFPPEMFNPATASTPTPAVDMWSAGCAYIEQLTRSWPLARVTQEQMPQALRELETVQQAYLGDQPLPKTSTVRWDKCIARAHKVDPEGTAFALRHLLARNPSARMSAAKVAEEFDQNTFKGRTARREIVRRVAARGLAAAINQHA